MLAISFNQRGIPSFLVRDGIYLQFNPTNGPSLQRVVALVVGSVRPPSMCKLGLDSYLQGVALSSPAVFHDVPTSGHDTSLEEAAAANWR